MKVYDSDKVEALIDAASTLLGNMYDNGSQGPSKMDADENPDLPKDEDGDPVWPDVWDLQAALDDIRDETTIRLPCFGIVVKVVGQSGTIESDLDKPQFDAIESLILAHACAGIDVTSPAYVEGIETAVEAVSNHLPDDLAMAARNALADLEGILPEFDPSGERTHPAWKTIAELRKVLADYLDETENGDTAHSLDWAFVIHKKED